MADCVSCGEDNPTRARFCLGCGQPLPVDGPIEVRRTVTIVFADLVESTSLGESLDPEAMRAITGRYYKVMRASVDRHEGAVEKFIGDAVVAVFGMPRVREDDATRAVRAARDMHDALATLNDELDREWGVRLLMRIGVNTGEVIVGEGRSGGSFATGDAVNIAARLQQNAGISETLIGDQTYRLVRDLVEVTAVPPVAVKGKAEPVTAWRLSAVTAILDRDVPPNTPFVGRQSQLHLLDEAYKHCVEERVCQLVTVLGSAGMGKSRLAEEFIASLGAARVLRGRCLSYGEGGSYWPLREALMSAFGLSGSEQPDTARETFTRLLPANADTPGIALRLSAVTGFEPESTMPELVPWAVRMTLESLAAERPVVLVVDDLHWAADGLLQVIEHIADWSRGAPILLLALARTEFFDDHPTWGGGKLNSVATVLAPLDEKATASLIGRHALPPAIEERVVAAASGNPLFVEQLVAMLADDGHLVAHDETLTWADGEATIVELAMPPTISALLAARLDRLDEDERKLLQCAAVIGSVFYVEGLVELTGLPTDEVRRALSDLVRRELLRTAPSDLPGLTAYRFLHGLVRDAAYDGLAKARRAELHERLADWLLAVVGKSAPSEIVGYHLESAWRYRRQLSPDSDPTRQLARRAATHLAAAGRRLELSDVIGASALLARAAAVLPPADAEGLAIQLDLGSQLSVLGRFAEARDALTIVGRAEDAALSGRARLLLCYVDSHTGSDPSSEESERIFDDLVPLLMEQGDHRGLSDAYLAQSHVEVMRNRFARQETLLELAAEHGTLAGDEVRVSRARSLLPTAYRHGPVPAEEAIRRLRSLQQESADDPTLRARSEMHGSTLHAICGRFDEARALSDAGKASIEALGRQVSIAAFPSFRAHLEELMGDVDAADRDYLSSCESLARLGEHSFLSTIAGERARLLARAGRFPDVAAPLELAKAHAAADDVVTLVLIDEVDALLHAEAGRFDEADTAMSHALRLVAEFEAPENAGETHATAAAVAAGSGDVDREREHLQIAHALFSSKGNVVRARAMDQAMQRLVGAGRD